MKKIISIGQLPGLVRILKRDNLKIVLVGGCFDVMHPGHVIFLEKAKKEGDILVVLLENDKKVCLLKGKDRPVHIQLARAEILSALKMVDFVVLLPFMDKDSEYDKLISQIKPVVIAVTEGYENIHHKRLAKLVGAKLKFVTRKVGNYSTSRILKGTVQ